MRFALGHISNPTSLFNFLWRKTLSRPDDLESESQPLLTGGTNTSRNMLRGYARNEGNELLAAGVEGFTYASGSRLQAGLPQDSTVGRHPSIGSLEVGQREGMIDRHDTSTEPLQHGSDMSAVQASDPGNTQSLLTNSAATRALYYDKTPLTGPRMIRVFKLHESTNSDDVIKGDLTVMDLDNRPSFNALTYHWGKEDNDPKYTIFCGSHTMKVGKNCWDALWHLRKRYRSIDIWIDAICIDQKNQKEKTIQLPLMGDIYRKADCVFVWLGEGDNETNRAMEFLGKGGLPFDVAFDLAKGDRILTRYLIPWYYGLCMFGRCVTFRRKHHWDGLQNIFNRIWVTRLWTLQEFVLPRHIVLICGDVAISWQSFKKALRLMRFMDGRPGGPRFPASWKQWWRLSTFRSSIQELLDKVSDQILEHDNRKAVESYEFELEVRFLETTWTSFRVWYFCAAASLIPAFYGVTLLDARFKEDILRLPFFTRLIVVVVKFLAIVAVVTTIIWPQMMSKNSMTEMTLDMHEHIFTEIVKRDATNEKDRYFGVSALIQQVVRHNDTPLPPMSSSDFTTGTPDYNTSLTLAYERLFIELLKWTDSLDILLLRSCRRCSCENCSCQKTVDGPSWLVNWAFTDERWLLMRHYLVLENSFLAVRKVYKTFSDATSFERRHAKANFLVDGRLHVRGMLIGMITWCSELLPQDKNLKKRETVLSALGMFQEAFRH